jgi:hypothetical protein
VAGQVVLDELLDLRRLERLLALMPRYEIDWDGCARVHMQNVVGWSQIPVRIIR